MFVLGALTLGGVNTLVAILQPNPQKACSI